MQVEIPSSMRLTMMNTENFFTAVPNFFKKKQKNKQVPPTKKG